MGNSKTSKSFSKLSTRQLLILAAILLFAIVGTTTLYFILLQKEKETLTLDFKSTSKELTSAIEKEISLNLQALASIKSLYAVTDTISSAQFKTFNSNVLNRLKSIQGLGWIPKVKFEEKKLFETRARNNGLSQFLITEKFDGKMVPVNNREVYYPVFYLEPFIGNEKAIGFDLASDLTRRSAIEKSIALDSLVATARITLVQEKSSQKAILVFCPHKKETELIGLFSGVFRIEDLINSALGHLVNSECNLNIYDISAEEGSQLLAQIGAQDFPPLPDDTAINIPKGIHYQQKIKIADREWLILSTPTQSYLNSFPKSALLILIICIILSMGVLYFLYRNFKEINQRKSIEREVINAIIFSQEEDRDYFAEDLHEGLAQTLFGLSFHIRAVESKFKESDDESLKSSLSLIKEYIYQSLENARKLSKDLMPRSMMKYGLIASLEQHIDNLKTTSDLNIVFNSNKNELKIDKDIEITIYRSIVAIFEKVKASPSSKNISIEINDDESTLQVKIEIFRQITFINDLHIKSNNSLLPFQKRIELHGGQLIIDKEAKKNRTIVIIQFDTKTKKAKFLKKEMGISTY